MTHRVLFLFASAACAPVVTPTYVMPAERVLAVRPTGEKVAIYDVVTAAGTVATVKVWSNGVDAGDVDGQPVTLVHVGLEVTGTGAGPVTLQPPELRIDGEARPALATRAEAVEVAPGSERRVEAYFHAAPGVLPQDIGRFAVRWTLATYTQSTEFIADPGLAITPFVKKFRPASELRRHPRIVIRDGLVAR